MPIAPRLTIVLHHLIVVTALLATAHLTSASGPASGPAVRSGTVWHDDRGQKIQAHGGGVVFWSGTYYWFGEDYSQSNEAGKRYVGCYSSKDLVHWKFRRQVLALADPEHLGPKWILERPKVYPNRKTGKFVLYAHLDDATYKTARVAVAVSDRIDGDYRYVSSFRPLGEESRDIGQFLGDDGSAYLIFESRPTGGFFIAQLSDDYLSVVKKVSFLHAPLEGGAVVHYQGLYYVIGSHLSGWNPNPNVFATSASLAGPWTEFRDIAPPQANTYGSQSTYLLKVVGTKNTTVIFMADLWHPEHLWDSRYLWMPLELGAGNLQLPAPRDWTIDLRTGESHLLQ